MNLTYQQFVAKYGLYFAAATNKTAINPDALAMLSYSKNKGNLKLLAANNFFATGALAVGAPLDIKHFSRYGTPFESLNEAIKRILKNSNFVTLKAGTLKRNAKLQAATLQKILI
tara:strand:+ start:8600 stop:8944 length:345 start_codon:yes stop_codon:yes gene_type:complete